MLQVESLAGGLVTSRDATLLEPGELSGCDNAIYKPNSQAIHRSQGWTEFNGTAISANIVGLEAAVFHNGARFLIAQAGSAYYTSNITAQILTGTFASADAITSGNTLDAVQFENKFFLLNGANLNRVFRQDGTFRQHGLQPVKGALNAVTAAGTFAASATGYYEYWATEVYEITATATEVTTLESTFSGDPATIQVTNTATQTVTIGKPPFANPGLANKWRVYRAGPKQNKTDKLFPIGYKIAELAVTTDSFSDTSGAAGSLTAPTASAESAGTAWTNPNNVFGAGVATLTGLPAPSGPTIITSTPTWVGEQGYKTFTLSVTEPIVGIEVQVNARVTAGNGALGIALGWNGASSIGVFPYKTGVKQLPKLTTSLASYTVGGSNDLWGRTAWTSTDLNNTNFRCILWGSTSDGNAQTGTIEVDFINVRLYTNGTPPTAQDAFPAVITVVEGLQAAVGRNSPPPTASTGDIFENSLVCNDVSDVSLVRYSTPGEPEYFPSIYFVNFEHANDTVTNIKTLGNRLLVMLKNQVWRLNYLPREFDASFDRGRAMDLVDLYHGCVGPSAATTYVDGEGRPAVAFVSAYGLYTTDGYVTRELSGDLDWSLYTDPLQLSRCILLNNPELAELIMIYPTSGFTGGYAALHFNYHPTHMKSRGQLKASGPVVLQQINGGGSAEVGAAAVLQNTDGTVKIYTGYRGSALAGRGKVYVHQGTAVPYAPNTATNITTRRMYLAGLGKEFLFNKLYLYHSSPSVTGTLNVQPLIQKTGVAEDFSIGPKSIDVTFAGLSGVSFLNVQTEAARFQLTSVETTTPPAVKLEALVVPFEEFQEEDSLK